MLLRQLSRVGEPAASPRVTLARIRERVRERLVDLVSSSPDKCGPAERRRPLGSLRARVPGPGASGRRWAGGHSMRQRPPAYRSRAAAVCGMQGHQGGGARVRLPQGARGCAHHAHPHHCAQVRCLPAARPLPGRPCALPSFRRQPPRHCMQGSPVRHAGAHHRKALPAHAPRSAP